MDITIVDDPELAQDLVKLLHDKLRQARLELQELREASYKETVLIDSTALRSENETLRDELRALQTRLSSAAQHVDGEDINPAPADVGDTTEGYEEGTETAAADQDRGIERLQTTQLQKYRMKYKDARAEIAELQETLRILQSDLEREKTGLSECMMHIEATQAGINDRNAVCATHEAEPFDPATFISTPRPSALDRPRASSLQSLLRSQPLSQLPPYVIEKFGPIDMLLLSSSEVTWSGDGIERVLWITHSHRYRPAEGAGKARWVSNEDAQRLQQDTNRTRELFFRRKEDWYYYGTYRYTGSISLSPAAAKTLDASRVQRAKNTTIAQKDCAVLAPGIAPFFATAYLGGPLSVQCLGLERVGFREELYTALLSSRRDVQTINSSQPRTKKQHERGVPGQEHPLASTSKRRGSEAGPTSKPGKKVKH
ncbi:hypothetical protein BD413DRAFT_506739 [Trametes elegans]|nr:hypothetical protein BD413DRAFT_506739 [Trametes elegans]